MKTPTSPYYPVGWIIGFSGVLVMLAFGCTLVLGTYIWTITANPAGQWWRILVPLLAWFVAMRLLWLHYRRRTSGLLRFDGERWWFESEQLYGHAFAEQVVVLECVWTLPHHIWLRLRWDCLPDVKPLAAFYVWASMGQDVNQWQTFRRALMFYKLNRKQPVSAQI